MDKEWLSKLLTVEEAEASNLVSDDRLGPSPVPFGFLNDHWQKFVSQMTPGDELWNYISPPESWAHLAGCAGVALVRQGEIIDEFMTLMN